MSVSHPSTCQMLLNTPPQLRSIIQKEGRAKDLEVCMKNIENAKKNELKAYMNRPLINDDLIIGFDLETTGILETDIVTVACVWSPYNNIRVSCFFGEDFSPVLDLLDAAKYIYTFNGISFDLPRIAKQCGRDMTPWLKKTVDPLYMMKGVLGFGACMKLNDLLLANGFETKSGCGLAAVQFWKDRNLEALSSYCLDDARLTYELCASDSILWGKWRVNLREAKAVSFV